MMQYVSLEKLLTMSLPSKCLEQVGNAYHFRVIILEDISVLQTVTLTFSDWSYG